MFRVVEFALARPRAVLCLVLVLVLGCGAGLVNFQLSSDPRIYFGAGNPDFERMQAIEDTYTASEVAFIVLEPHDGTIFTRRNLGALERLTAAGWELPRVQRVDSIANYRHTWAEGDDLYAEALVDGAADLDAAQIERIRSIVLEDPDTRFITVSDSGHVAGVSITFILDSREDTRRTAAAARELVDRFRDEYPDINFHLTGTVVVNNAMAEATLHEMQTTAPLSVAVIMLVLAVLLRSLLGMLITLLVVVLSNVVALGIVCALGIVLAPVAGFAITIILTLAVADCVHILSTCQYRLGMGDDREAAIRESMRVNLQPVFLTSLTTAIGFLCLNASESPPFRVMGNLVAIGVVAAFLFSVLLVPALLRLLPPLSSYGQLVSFGAMERLAGFVCRYRKPLAGGIGVLLLALLACVPRNEFNDVWLEYFDDSFEVRRANDFVADNLHGLHRIQFSISAGEPGGISEPAYLHGLERFREWLLTQEKVVYVTSYTDTLKRLNRNMHGDDPDWYRIPESRELAAQYLLLYEMSLPHGLGLENRVNMDRSATRLLVMVERSSSREILDLARRAEDWMAANLPSAMQASATGLDLVFGNLARRNSQSMLVGTLAAFMAITALLAFALRSLRLGLLSILPNMAPVGMAFGIWGLAVGQVGLTLSVVACMTLGIVVDDTVHFVSKYVRARREHGYDPEAAVHYAFRTVGVALLITSGVLAAGFAVTVTSPFWPNASMGALTALVIVLALVVDFLCFVPVLLLVETRGGRGSGDLPAGRDLRRTEMKNVG